MMIMFHFIRYDKCFWVMCVAKHRLLPFVVQMYEQLLPIFSSCLRAKNIYSRKAKGALSKTSNGMYLPKNVTGVLYIYHRKTYPLSWFPKMLWIAWKLNFQNSSFSCFFQIFYTKFYVKPYRLYGKNIRKYKCLEIAKQSQLEYQACCKASL
jgi:hypothetical protein